jgi:hypothetical protein
MGEEIVPHIGSDDADQAGAFLVLLPDMAAAFQLHDASDQMVLVGNPADGDGLEILIPVFHGTARGHRSPDQLAVPAAPLEQPHVIESQVLALLLLPQLFDGYAHKGGPGNGEIIGAEKGEFGVDMRHFLP